MSILSQTSFDTVRTDYAHENAQHKERTVRMSILQGTLSQYTFIQGTRENSYDKWRLPLSALQKGVCEIFCHSQTHAIESFVCAL